MSKPIEGIGAGPSPSTANRGLKKVAWIIALTVAYLVRLIYVSETTSDIVISLAILGGLYAMGGAILAFRSRR